jgi:hypothetical protein
MRQQLKTVDITSIFVNLMFDIKIWKLFNEQPAKFILVSNTVSVQQFTVAVNIRM